MERTILKLEASAGSGKTYRLALEYLGRLLSTFSTLDSKPENLKFRQKQLGSILAITFTVKAAREMKERIVEKLKRFALSARGHELKAADKEFLDQLADETSLSAEKIIALSGELIELVLTNYDDFNVKTIDSLMSAIIQVIAPDLDLPAGYETALNARDELQTRARALLADLADNDWTRLKQTLADLKKLGFNKGWKTDEELAGSIIELFHLAMRQGIAGGGDTREKQNIRFNCHLDDFNKKLEDLLKILAAGAEHVNGRVVNSNLLESAAAFSRERNDLYKLDQLLTRAFFKKADPRELLKKSAPEPYFEKVSTAYEQMHASQQEMVLDLSIFKTFPYSEFFPDFVQRWQEGKDTLFLEEFSQTLAGRFAEWGKTGFPYLYLKMSDRFIHFLFDEFQDTSTLQFKALAPLIDEVLSRDKKSSLFIVGDRKQAIYRWRGGNSELMGEDALRDEVPSIGNREKKGFSLSLVTNWRSREEIVKFNNKFWAPEAISQVAAEPELQAAIKDNFNDSQQELPTGQERMGGYVELSCHEDNSQAAGEGVDAARDEEEDGSCMSGGQLLEIESIIARLQQHGFKHPEIAVLVRKNIQVRDIIRHLNRKGISTLSDQSLLLSANPRVNEIMAFLGFLDYPPDDLYFHAFVSGDIFQAEATKRFPDEMAAFGEDVFIDRRGPSYKLFQQKFPASWSGLLEPFFQAVGFLPPYDLFSDFCQVFRVYENFPGDTPFFMALGDTLHRSERQEDNSIAGFLRRWGKMVEDEETPTVAIPENTPGVRVLTMHQSKGLEFPAVIVPLNESREKNPGPLYWNQGQLFYISSEYAQVQDDLKEILQREKKKNSIDLLNLLYVAFTRAKEALFVPVAVKKMPAAPAPDKNGMVRQIARTSDVICRHPLLAWSEKKPDRPFTCGGLKKIEKSPAKETHPEAVISKKVMTRSWQADYLVFKETCVGEQHDRSGAERGDRVHSLLSRLGPVIDPGQLAARVEELAAAEQWPVKDITALSGFICSDAVFPLLTRGREFSSEKEVADNSKPKPDFLRLDRMQVGPEEVLVIDFKTGTDRNPGHEVQMRKYLAALAPLFPGKKCAGYLLYIDREEVAEVSCSS